MHGTSMVFLFCLFSISPSEAGKENCGFVQVPIIWFKEQLNAALLSHQNECYFFLQNNVCTLLMRFSIKILNLLHQPLIETFK